MAENKQRQLATLAVDGEGEGGVKYRRLDDHQSEEIDTQVSHFLSDCLVKCVMRDRTNQIQMATKIKKRKWS